MIKITQTISELNISKILKYLDKIKKPILYNKIGLLLELNKNKLQIDTQDIEKIRKKLSKNASERAQKLVFHILITNH
jgi:hypothetical protein